MPAGHFRSFCLVLACAAGIPGHSWSNGLDAGSFELLFDEPITLSVTGMPLRESDVPVNMEIIRSQEILRSGALNIPDVLKRLAGIDVIQWTANHYDVGIRGYNQTYNPSLLVLINGRQVYFNDSGRIAWTHLPVQMEDIRQIEVVRGPNTALFGFNAASGMINIVTFNPIYDQKATIRTEFGTHGTGHLSSSFFSGNFHGAGLGISAGTSELGNHDNISSPGAAQIEVDPEDENASFNGVYEISERTQIEVDGFYARSRYNEWETGYSLADSTYRSTSLRGRLFHDSRFGRWSFSAYENDLRASLQSQSTNFLNQGEPITGSNTVRIISLQNEFIPFGNHSVRIYAETRDNQIQLDTVSSDGSRFGYDVKSLGGTWHWNEAGSFGLMASGRLDMMDLRYEGEVPFPLTSDDFDRELTEPSFNLAGLWRPTQNNAFRASVGRGIRAPSLFNLGLDFDPIPTLFNARIIGNPQLDPTTVDTAELSFTRQLKPIQSEVKFTAFYQEYQDFSATTGFSANTISILGGVPVLQGRQAGGSNSIGFEAALDGALTPELDYRLNYSFVHVDDDLSVNELNSSTPDYAISFEDSVPKHRVNMQLNYHKGNWNADLFGFWQSSRRLLQSTPTLTLTLDDIDPEFNADARVSYTVGDRIELSLTATNILGTYNSTSDTSIDRRILAGARIKLF